MPEASVDVLALHPDRHLLPWKFHKVCRDHNLDEEMAAFALELARIPEGLDKAQRRDLVLGILALQATLAQGHTRMPLDPGADHPARRLLAACDRGDLDLAALADPAGPCGCLFGAGDDARPFLAEGGHLYSQRLRAVEDGFAGRVKAILDQAPPVPGPVPEAVLTDPDNLNSEQRAAIALALGQPLALVTGAPGTGKTSIIVAILRALLHQGMDLDRVALAAPTGKAAQRMGGAIRRNLARVRVPGPVEERLRKGFPEPQTLHRLLSWLPAQETFRHGADNPLAAQVVIVDEASMVSQELMDSLFQALAPGARIVLLGDADQLPSVECGSTFGDLVATLGGCTQWLAENLRMKQSDPAGCNILGVALALQKDPGALWQGEQPIRILEGLGAWRKEKVELLDPGEDGPGAFLDRWFKEVVLGLDSFKALATHAYHWNGEAWGEGEPAGLRALFDHHDSFRILCALRDARGLRGVEDINRQLHAWMQPVTGAGLKHGTAYYSGEPILMRTNDYRRGIYNGDQGLVLRVVFPGGEERQAAVFPSTGGFQPFLLDALRPQVELCYAMTVHKAQGSEYDRIAIVLPGTDHPALTRELLYTAVTRARKSVTLVAEPARVDWAAVNLTRRDTGLRERLKRP